MRDLLSAWPAILFGFVIAIFSLWLNSRISKLEHNLRSIYQCVDAYTDCYSQD